MRPAFAYCLYMDTEALQKRIGEILAEEERADPNWAAIDAMCDKLRRDLGGHSKATVPHIMWHFLSDSDIRAKDADYGQKQRLEIRCFVETGKCNDSKQVSPWGCIGTVALFAALIFWLFR